VHGNGLVKLHRRRAIVHLAIAVAVVATGLVGGAAAQADAQIASYLTPGCESAPVWHIRFDLYWTDSQGHSTDPSVLPGVLSATELFVDDVGPDSGCGIRLQIDVFDEGTAVWPVNPNPAYPARPADLDAALAAGYDSEFIRIPARGDEPYAGITSPAPDFAAGAYSEFPVTQAGSQLPGYPNEVDPWAILQMHEWLHQVVAFYDPALGWPTNDVHGACEHGYIDATKGACSQVDEHYFADMMQGKVAEAGGMRGITAADFAKDGTPARPVRAVLGAPALVPRGSFVRLSFPSIIYDGAIAVSAESAAGIVVGQGTTSGAAPTFDWLLPAKAGSYQLCWAAPGTARFRPQRGCEGFAVRRDISAISLPVVHVTATRKPGTYTVRVTYQATVESVLENPDPGVPAPDWTKAVATLVVRRGAQVITSRHLRLDHASKTITFSAHLPRAARNATIQLRPQTGGGSFASSAPRTVALPQPKP
jgi:hypothetical protein